MYVYSYKALKIQNVTKNNTLLESFWLKTVWSTNIFFPVIYNLLGYVHFKLYLWFLYKLGTPVIRGVWDLGDVMERLLSVSTFAGG